MSLANRPGLQPKQLVAPVMRVGTPTKVPRAQGVHSSEPSFGSKVPAAQAVQMVLPLMAEYWPGEHGVQAGWAGWLL